MSVSTMPDEGASGDHPSSELGSPLSHRTVKSDTVTSFLAIVAIVLTWAQLPVTRAISVTVAIVALVGGGFAVIHLAGLRRIAAVVGATAIAIASLVLVQTIPLDSASATSGSTARSGTGTDGDVTGNGPSTEPAAASPSVPPRSATSPTSPVPRPAPRSTTVTVGVDNSRTVFSDSLRIGVPALFDSFAEVVLQTANAECTGSPDVGASLTIGDGTGGWFRITLTSITSSPAAASFAVQEGSGSPPASSLCFNS